MVGPTPSDILETLRRSGDISPTEYQSYSANYDHFVREVSRDRNQYAGKWVAAVNQQIIIGNSYRELKNKLEPVSGSQLAYVEQVQ